MARATRERTELAFAAAPAIDDRSERAALLVWAALSRVGELAPGADVAATSRAWFDELRFPAVLAAGMREGGLDEGEAWAVADLTRVLLALPRPSALGGPARTADARLLESWLGLAVVRTAMGVNTWQGVEYLDRDAFAAMLRWAGRLDAIEAGLAGARARRATPERDLEARLSNAAETAGYRVDVLRASLAAKAPASATARTRPRSRPAR